MCGSGLPVCIIFGWFYLYIGITSCVYKISQKLLFFNWEMKQNRQNRLVNIADSEPVPLTDAACGCYNSGDMRRFALGGYDGLP